MRGQKLRGDGKRRLWQGVLQRSLNSLGNVQQAKQKRVIGACRRRGREVYGNPEQAAFLRFRSRTVGEEVQLPKPKLSYLYPDRFKSVNQSFFFFLFFLLLSRQPQKREVSEHTFRRVDSKRDLCNDGPPSKGDTVQERNPSPFWFRSIQTRGLHGSSVPGPTRRVYIFTFHGPARTKKQTKKTGPVCANIHSIRPDALSTKNSEFP